MYLEDGAGLEDVVGLAKDIKGLARILGKIWRTVGRQFTGLWF